MDPRLLLDRCKSVSDPARAVRCEMMPLYWGMREPLGLKDVAELSELEETPREVRCLLEGVGDLTELKNA